MAGRQRNTSLEIIQSKADSIRALNLDDVDADLAGADADEARKRCSSFAEERTPEDDEAIAAAIEEVEEEMTKASTWMDILNLGVVMVAVAGGIYYLQIK
jgi:hypothetical protein